jgi:hypothetical protein
MRIGELGADLMLRFDPLLGRVKSRLSVIYDGQIIETIHFRLETVPDVLFARIRTPAPGDYIVRWTVWLEGRDEGYEVELPFTVGDIAAGAVVPRL